MDINQSKINIETTTIRRVSRLSAFFGLINRLRQVPVVVSRHPSWRKGRGLSFRNKLFIHHTDLDYSETAFFVLSFEQKLVLIGAGVVVLAAFLINWHFTLIAVFSLLTFLYFADLIFNGFLIFRSFARPPEISVSEEEIAWLSKVNLPTYTIFCPLYKEWQVIPQFMAAIDKLDWPKEKLQVMLLLEEDDKRTIEKVAEYNLPSYVQVVVVPHSMPKTKPKAMNYGLSYARGEYLVIYDAEDMPDPDQLKTAYIALKKSPEDVVCVQAKLNFYNPKQNLLTRMFAAEYSLWFDLVLTGLQTLAAPIPLGGTSNHFRVRDLKKLSGWDAFNVTEDCDLGLRMVKRGYRTAIIDSTTYEEANSQAGNWYRQRSRWIKGYIQTYLVHMRRPMEMWQGYRRPHLLTFQLVVGGKVLSLFINPVMWGLTLTYFLFRSQVGGFIESFFPAPILYTGVVCLVAGNFLYLYYYMIGLAKRGYFDLIKYAFLVPVYWIGMSIAAWQAVYEIIVKPHYWAKTVHGLHLGAQEAGAVDDENPGWRKYQKLGSGSVLVGANLAANFLNFLFSAYLGRHISLEEFGVINVFNTVLSLFNIFVGGLFAAVNHRVSYLSGKYSEQSAVKFFRHISRYVMWYAISVSVAWLLLAYQVAIYFKVQPDLVVYSLMPAFGLVVVAAAYRGFLQGRLVFMALAASVFFEAFTKLLSGVVLSSLGLSHWVPVSIPVSMFFGWGIAYVIGKLSMRKSESRDISKSPGRFITNFPKRFYAAVTVSGLASVIFLSADVVLAKHYLDPKTAGAYGLLSLVGRMVFIVGTLLSNFTVPIVTREIARGKDPNRKFYLLFGGAAVLSISSAVFFGPLGHLTVPLLFGPKAREIVPYFTLYAFATVCFTLASMITGYHLIRKQFAFLVLSLGAAGALVFGLSQKHGSILDFVMLEWWVSLGYLGMAVVWHFLARNGEFLLRNFVDLLNVFAPLRQEPVPVGGKRILVFNWRDTMHSFAGGAEVYIHELAKRWVRDGNSVTLFSGNDSKQPRQEYIDGVRVIRRGGFYFVYIWAFVYYVTHFRGRFDVIVDCHNGIPFFTPMFAKEPVVAVLHHVHQDVFYKFLPLPLAWFAAVLENRLMPYVYRNCQFITVSESSKREMIEWGIKGRGIEVISPGINIDEFTLGERHAQPTVLYLGRLKAYKSVDVLLRAFKSVRESVHNARLVIAGAGEELNNLIKLSKDLGIDHCVEFAGKVDDVMKMLLYQQAWVFVNPSLMEGWGITTIEANACGVPVVASKVPGLVDSVRNPHTGFLVPHGDEQKFAERIGYLLGDSKKREWMGKEARDWAESFDWDKNAERAMGIMESVRQ